ncbi:sigma-70 family RNA polymerase sigma factor [Streptomyces sp. 8N114]|uniref:sigma-70 family RNA polymerase sigma factor n=1 Tax=Streptomyces sp. 8N114 TaxID=3457419 RepID=UPI003FD1CE5F
MTIPSESPVPAPGPAPARPGRKLGPIADNVGSSHRAWLEPVRETYLASGRTLSDLSDRVWLHKSKLSELLRGLGLYPRWEIIHRLSTELAMPDWPLYWLWRQAALDAQKSSDWIERSGDTPTLTTAHAAPPLEHSALRQMVESYYHRYAQVFLLDEASDIAVADTFDRLWLSWDEALSSPDTRRFAWNVLRTTVMAKTPHLDGQPELARAAFDTVALQTLTTETDRMHQIEESLKTFQAISRLPGSQLDVMVLRYLCGMTPEETSSLLGVPLAAVRSDERQAIRCLESILCPPPETEGHTA